MAIPAASFLAAAALAGAVVSTGVTLMMVEQRPAPPCACETFDPSEADRLHREFMRGPQAPMDGGRRF